MRALFLSSIVCAVLAMPVPALAAGITVGGFHMDYPAEWSVKYLPGYDGSPNRNIAEFKGGAGFKRTVWAEAHDILSFNDGIAMLRKFCDADGGYSSYSCPSGKVVREFTTKSGLKAAEVLLVLERRVAAKTERKRFRAYIVHDGHHRGVLVHAVYTEGVTGGNGDIRSAAEKLLAGITLTPAE